MKRILIYFAFLFLITSCGAAQNIDKISHKCQTPNQNVFSNILIVGDGGITQTPCPTKANTFFGNVDFTNATVTGLGGSGFVTTSGGVINFIPNYTSATALTATPFSWNGTTYAWNNTALNGNFLMSFKPSTAVVGTFSVGGSNDAIGIDEATHTINITSNTVGGVINLNGGGTTGGVNLQGGAAGEISVNNLSNNHIYLGNNSSFTTGIDITFTDAGSEIDLNANILKSGNIGNTTHTFNSRKFLFTQRTLTAGGTTGAQVIDKSVGSVNFAIGASTLVVTSSMAFTTSLILVTPQAADATCTSFAVTRAGGSFTITANAACTAETAVAFLITN